MAEGEERSSGGRDDKKGKYPVGFRFKPTDEELVEYYLLPKLQGKPSVPNDAIIEADVYESDPEILINQKYKDRGENRWYFLSPRTRKYQGGTRPSRRTADDRGRWKPSTGKSEPNGQSEENGIEADKGKEKLCSNGAVKYCENTLAYHVGPSKKGKKTKWLMHELTVPEYEIKLDSSRPSNNTMLLDRYVMCTIYKSPLTKWAKQEEGETSSARAEAASSSEARPAPESGQGTAPPPTLSNKQVGKRPAAEQQPPGHATAPKRAPQPTRLARGPPATAPVHDNGGGGGGRMRGAVPLGAAATGYFYSVPGHDARMPWPPATCNHLQGPVQLKQQGVYDRNGRPVIAAPYGGQAPVQGQRPGPASLRPPPQADATAHNALGRTMIMMPRALLEDNMMRPQNGLNLAPWQTVVRPPYAPQPQPRMQPLPKVEMDAANEHRVLTQLLAELRAYEARQLSASYAQQQSPTASNPPPPPPQQQQPYLDAGGNDLPRANATFPHPHVSAPHGYYPRAGGYQQQQRSSAIPATTVPGGAAAPAEAATPGSESGNAS